ncbi:MAG TPA: aminotransferase class III-fold pyridoxal phosphate-dependent enzyme [Gemmatimonadaceae bacterium]|nr:aminotransferase class III-fold pyridoxal phosphate-dependent enzyme [Gemmatimonadaceae bacterium]
MTTDFLPPAIDDAEWHRRSRSVIAGGASTGSKRASAMYGSEEADLPTHFSHAAGCRLTTAGGIELVDCTMALGAVALGYADENVTHAVQEAAAQGNVAGLSHQLEVEVAERLRDVIPCAEQVRFLKSGAEGVAAAVRIARAHTGRSRVVGCGYFGWLDWWSDLPGVPAGAHADFTAVPFDDIPALESACATAGDTLAAIVIEPVIERLPSTAWIESTRRLADERHAILIFDEIKTGFRLKPAGYQEYSGIVPDLAVFGKALANGYPLSAVVGSEEIMSAAAKTWISSTLAGESVALAAANAVLDWHHQADVCASLADVGDEMMTAVGRAIIASGTSGVAVRGIAPMWYIDFGGDEERERRFLAIAVENGVLFKRGAYNFPSLAHEEEDVAVIEEAASEAFVRLRDHDDADR